MAPPTPLGDPITVGPVASPRSQTPTTLFRAHARARGSHYSDPSPHAKPRPPGSGPMPDHCGGGGDPPAGRLSRVGCTARRGRCRRRVGRSGADSGREEVVCGVVSEGDGLGVVS